MATCKTITFRPTPESAEALANLVEQHGNRSKAINAALVAAGVLAENGLALPKPSTKSTLVSAVVPAKPVNPKPTLAAHDGVTLRRTIQKPSWKHG